MSTGVNLTWFRAYDPELGRWLSRDPIGLRGGINLYEYVLSSVISHSDPLGLRPCADVKRDIAQLSSTLQGMCSDEAKLAQIHGFLEEFAGQKLALVGMGVGTALAGGIGTLLKGPLGVALNSISLSAGQGGAYDYLVVHSFFAGTSEMIGHQFAEQYFPEDLSDLENAMEELRRASEQLESKLQKLYDELKHCSP